MPFQRKRLQYLYDDISREYNVEDSYESFESKMRDENYRKEFHDIMRRKRPDIKIGDNSFDAFEEALGYKDRMPLPIPNGGEPNDPNSVNYKQAHAGQVQPQVATPVQPAPVGNVEAPAAQPAQPVQPQLNNGGGDFLPSTPVQPQTAEQPTAQQPVDGMAEGSEAYTAHGNGFLMSDLMQLEQMREAYDAAVKGNLPVRTVKRRTSYGTEETVEEYDPNAQKNVDELGKAYREAAMKITGIDDPAKAVDAIRYYNADTQVNQLTGEVERQMQEAVKVKDAADQAYVNRAATAKDAVVNPAGFSPAITARMTPEGMDDAAANAAVEYLKKAQEQIGNYNIEKGQRNSGTSSVLQWGANVGRGFGQKISDVSTWDFGITDVDQLRAVKAALDKTEDGKELTQAEESLINAYALNMAVMGAAKTGLGFSAGQTTAESLPFMLDMMFNPIAGVGKATSARVLRYMSKKLARNGLSGFRHWGMANFAKMEGMNLAKGAMLAVNPTQIGRTSANALRENIGGVQGTWNDKGEFVFDKAEDRANMGLAILKGLYQQTMENSTEFSGESTLSVAGEMLRSPGRKLMNSKAVKDFVEKMSEKKAVQTFNSWMDATKKLLNRLNVPQYLEVVSQLKEKAHISGLIGETNEEILNDIYNCIPMLGSGKPLFTYTDENGEEKQGIQGYFETMVNLMPQQIFMGFLGAGDYGVRKTWAYRNMRKSLNTLLYDTDAFGEISIEDKKAKLDEILNSENVGESLADAVKDMSITEREAVCRYVIDAQYYRGLKEADEVNRTHDIYQATFGNAYDQGHDAQDAMEQKKHVILADMVAKINDTYYMDKLPQEVQDYLRRGQYAEAIDAALRSHKVDDETFGWMEDFIQTSATAQGVTDHLKEQFDEQMQREIGTKAKMVYNGNLTTADYNGQQVYVTSDYTQGGAVTIKHADGTAEQVDASQLGNVQSQPFNEWRGNFIEQAHASMEEIYNLMLGHNDMPQAGQTITIGGESYQIAGYTEDGDVVAVRATDGVQGIIPADLATSMGQVDVMMAYRDEFEKRGIEVPELFTPMDQWQQEQQQAQQPKAENDSEGAPKAEGGTEATPHKTATGTTHSPAFMDLLDGEPLKLDDGRTIQMQPHPDYMETNKNLVTFETPEGTTTSQELTDDELEQLLASQKKEPEVATEEGAVISATEEQQPAEQPQQEAAPEPTPTEEPKAEEQQPQQEEEKPEPKKSPSLIEEEWRKHLAERVSQWVKDMGLDGRVDVHVLRDASEIPAGEKEAIRAIQKGEKVEGWFNPKTGQVYLLAPSLRAEERAKQVIFHEIVTHKGLKDLLGEERHNQLLDHVWESMDEADRRAQVEYVKQKKLTDEEYAEVIDSLKTRRAAADEYMAHFAEKNMEQSAWSKIVAAIRQWLREHIDGLKDMDITEDDIRAYLQASYKNLQKEGEVKNDRQGNPVDKDGNLIIETVSSIDEITDEDFVSPSRSVSLPALPAIIDKALGVNGRPVIIKKNIFEKNKKDHSDLSPSQSRQVLKSALYNANLYGKNKPASKPYNWVVINTKDEHGHNRIVLLEVNDNKTNVEIIHWHYIDDRGLEKLRRQAEREDGQLLILPSENSEEVGALSDPTHGLSSRGKGSESSSSDQTNEEKNEEKGKSSTSQSRNEKKKGGKIYDIAKFTPQRYDDSKPMLNGVYHDPAGYAVASDAKLLMWDKRQYDKTHSGEIIATRDYKADNVKKGDSISWKYPKWRSVIPVVGVRGRVAVKVDYEKIRSMLPALEEQLKREFEAGENTMGVILLNISNDVKIPVRLVYFKKFVDAALSLDANILGFPKGYGSITSDSENGGCLMMLAERVDTKAVLDLTDMALTLTKEEEQEVIAREEALVSGSKAERERQRKEREEQKKRYEENGLFYYDKEISLNDNLEYYKSKTDTSGRTKITEIKDGFGVLSVDGEASPISIEVAGAPEQMLAHMNVADIDGGEEEDYRSDLMHRMLKDYNAKCKPNMRGESDGYEYFRFDTIDAALAFYDFAKEHEQEYKDKIAEEDSKEAAEAERKRFGGFTNGMSKMKAGQVAAALDKKVNSNGKVATIGEHVKHLVELGKAVSVEVNNGKASYYIETERDGFVLPIPKIAYDYAVFLGDKHPTDEEIDDKKEESEYRKALAKIGFINYSIDQLKEKVARYKRAATTFNDKNAEELAKAYETILNHELKEQEKQAKQSNEETKGKEQEQPKEAEEKPVEEQSAKPAEKIEDVGEKIGGARKDLAKDMADKINLKADTFPKMFPKFNLAKLVEQGLDPKLAAAVQFLRYAGMEEFKLYKKRHVLSSALGAAKFAAAYAKRALETGNTNVDFTENGWHFTEYGKERILLNIELFGKIYDKLGNAMFDLDLSDYCVDPIGESQKGTTYFRNGEPFTPRYDARSGGYKHEYFTEEERDKAFDYVIDNLLKNVDYAAAHPYKISVYQTTSRGVRTYFIGAKIGNSVEHLSETFDKAEPAMKYLNEHEPELQAEAARLDQERKENKKDEKPVAKLEFRPGKENRYFSVISVKIGNEYVALTEELQPNRAYEYYKEHQEELQQKAQQLLDEYIEKAKSSKGWKPQLALGGLRARSGEDYRHGKDIGAEEFRNTFGFRGIEFGNYVTQKERQQFLNESYDALMDLAALLGVSPKALSLGGKLGFAIGARGQSSAAAHYEPVKNVINLTKKNGAGSLAHEWWHALDYFMNREGEERNDAATGVAEKMAFSPAMRKEMQDAFHEFMDVVSNSDYFKRSRALERKLHPDAPIIGNHVGYFDKPTELGARAFQDYVQRKLIERGASNDFLSSFTPEEKWNGETENYPYPKGEEATRISEAFDNLFGTMQEKTDEEGNQVLFSIGDQTKTKAFKDWFGDWEKDPEHSSKVVDENGEPRVVYHGTNSTEERRVWNEDLKTYDTEHDLFNTFERKVDGLRNSGFFFVADEDNAGGYGNQVYGVYLNMRNPLVIDAKGSNYNAIKHNGQTKDTYEWAEYAEKNGYDGVIFKNVRDGVDYGAMENPVDEYVVFRSNQIKSATDNNGEFSPENDDIRFSKFKEDKFVPRTEYLTLDVVDHSESFTRDILWDWHGKVNKIFKGIPTAVEDILKYVSLDIVVTDSERIELEGYAEYYAITLYVPKSKVLQKDGKDVLPMDYLREYVLEGIKYIDRNQGKSYYPRYYFGDETLFSIAPTPHEAAIDGKATSVANVLGKDAEMSARLSDIGNGIARRAIANGEMWAYMEDGKVHIYRPVMKDVNDAGRAVMQEVVGETPVRDIVGAETYDNALFAFHSDMEQGETKDMIANFMLQRTFDRMRNNGGKVGTPERSAMADAVDDWAAQMAEFGLTASAEMADFRNIVRDMLTDAGVDVDLYNADIDYMLWRSNLTRKQGGHLSAADIVRDADMREQYGIGKWSGENEPTGTDTADRTNVSNEASEEEQEEQYFGGEEPLFSRVTDKKLLEELNNGKTIKVYRAMQLVDGKLYPPMSGVLKGKMQEPIEADTWYQSDERPDLVEWRENQWKFPLQKNKKDSKMWVAYNPYWHTSRFPLNDQFSSAWNRPELVTVEVEVPESELTSGYHAEKAKDAVGEMNWHTGPVAGKLKDTEDARKVILSRYNRLVRVVPDSEIAEIAAAILKRHGLAVPFNVVTPSLRDELAKRGVTISEPGNDNSAKNSIPSYEEWKNGGETLFSRTDMTPEERKAYVREKVGATLHDRNYISKIWDINPFYKVWHNRNDINAQIPLFKFYRKVFPTPTLEDYYISTKVEFKSVGESREFDSIKDKHTDKDGKVDWAGFNKDSDAKRMDADAKNNQMWEDMKASGKYDWHNSPLSRSEYLIDVESGDIYRKSDHWGKAASCYWTIDISYADYEGIDAIGKANIKDFESLGGGPYVKRPEFEGILQDYLAETIDNYKALLDSDVKISAVARKKVEAALEQYEGYMDKVNNGRTLEDDVLKEEHVLFSRKPKTPSSMASNLYYAGVYGFNPKGRLKDKLEDAAAKAYKEKNWFKALGHELAEAYHDYLRSVRILQESIEKETGSPIQDYENVYWQAMVSSSRSRNEWEGLNSFLVQPTLDTIGRIVRKHRKDGIDQLAIERYMNAVHGLERNKKFARRDAKEQAEKEYKALIEQAVADGDEDLADELRVQQNNREDDLFDLFRKDDYSGLTAVFRTPEEKDTNTEVPVSELEARAEKFIKDFEGIVPKSEIDKLWDRMNALRMFTLDKMKSSGLLTKEQYETLRDQFKHYVPLKDFRLDTAEDNFEYFDVRGDREVILKNAKGRKTEAGSIIANLMVMANRAIVYGNKNIVKQALLALAENHKTGLLSVTNSWYELQNAGPRGGKKWVLVTPQPGDDPTEWEKEMRDKRKANPELYKTSKGGVGVGIPFERQSHLQQHQVFVKRGGKEYIVSINSAPNATQALNGLLNSDASDNKLLKWWRAANRWMSRAYTSLNPEFVLSNLQRDIVSASAVLFEKYGIGYEVKFQKNLTVLGWPTAVSVSTAKAIKAGMTKLYKKYSNGALDMSVERERLFAEFLKNGGETGYASTREIEEFERDIDAAIKNNKPKALFRKLGGFVEESNRSIENLCRFAAYMTSRQSGRTILESIQDAKEASVNFNRKGSGALGASFFRNLYIFFNPGVQGLAQRIKMLGSKRGWGAFAFMLFSGALATVGNIILGAYLFGGGDDDDDKYGNPYMNLSDFRRHNSLNIRLGNKAFRWDLSHEDAAIFGIGAIIAEYTMDYITKEEAMEQIGVQLSQALPIDIIAADAKEGGYLNKLLNEFTPSAAKPFVEIYGSGKDWLNRPINGRKESGEYGDNHYLPEYKRVTKDVNPVLNKAVEKLNTFTGGDAYHRGWLERKLGTASLNANNIDHIGDAYLGGMYSMMSKFSKSADYAWDKYFNGENMEDRELLRNIPFVSRLLTDLGAPRNKDKRLYSRFNDFYYTFKEIDARMNRAKSDLKNGDEKVKKEAREFLDNISEEQYYKQYQLWNRRYESRYNTADKAYKDAFKRGDDRKMKEARERRTAIVREAVKAFDEIKEKE